MSIGVVLLWTLIECLKSWDVVNLGVESWGENKSLVGQFLAIVKDNSVGCWVKLGDSCIVDGGPRVDHVHNNGGLEGEWLLVLMGNIEVGLWHTELHVLAYDSHLEVLGILMELSGLQKTGSSSST